MKTGIAKWTQALAGVAFVAGACSLPASAATYGDVHHPRAHRIHSSDVTVQKSVRREPVAAAPDAFHGPAAFITAPVEIAGTLVSLPFRAIDVVFPSRANDPRVLVGAPVHFAGQIAESPFFAFNSAFGVRPTYYSFN